MMAAGDCARLGAVIKALPTAEARAEALSLLPSHQAAEILASMRPDERDAAMEKMPIDQAAAAKARRPTLSARKWTLRRAPHLERS